MDLKRSRYRLAIIATALVVALIVALSSRRNSGRTESAHSSQTTPTNSLPAGTFIKSQPRAREEPLIGERILKHYADPARPPEEDLVWMSRALENFALLVKGDNPLPLGANEDIANALRGKNRARLRVLRDQHPAFNAQGQLVDRWGTPLFFHANAHDRLDIRSAGPDREMWTADDLHRQHDGRFLHGEALLAPSLFDSSTSSR